jgi:polyhydroxyalkanoate synthesis regulator phasin
MAENDILKRYLEAGMAFTQMTRTRAEAIVKDLVHAGDVQREQAQDRVEELVERSRKNTDALLALVRKEIRSQLKEFGITSAGRGRSAATSSGAASPVKKAATSAKKASTSAKKTTTKAAGATKKTTKKTAKTAKKTTKKAAKKA